LVDDHVRKFGQPVRNILDQPGPSNPLAIFGDRPEGGFVDPQGLPNQGVRQSERFEHFNGPASHTIGMTARQRLLTSVDRTHGHLGELRQLCRQNRSGRSSSHDQDINLFRQVHALSPVLWCGRSNTRIAEGVTVEVILHVLYFRLVCVSQHILCRKYPEVCTCGKSNCYICDVSKSTPRIEAIHRALQVLKLMASQGSVSVGEAAEYLKVNPSTASRVLTTIEADGFAVRGEKRRYHPGASALHFGKSLTTPPLHERLRPHLERLSSLVHETVHIATLVGTTVHHQDAIVATDHALVLTSRIGKRLPAHLASSGKVMLADLDPAV